MAGYNTNLEHKGSLFHVQTQDLGSPSNCIETTIYKSGRALTSRKTFYTSIIGQPDNKEKIFMLLKDQHERICQEIQGGKLDHL